MSTYFAYQISSRKIDHYQNSMEVDKNELLNFELKYAYRQYERELNIKSMFIKFSNKK
jgi:hypothetical protein